MSILEINNFEIALYIGVKDTEKIQKQNISIYVKLIFKELPKIALTDHINDGICYEKLCLSLKFFENKKIETIEYLCKQIHDFLYLRYGKYIKNLLVSVSKTPNIDSLNGNVTFSIRN